MLANSTPIYLLASPDPALLAALEPVLAADGARVEIHLSAETALLALTAAHAPTLALIDVNLPGMESWDGSCWPRRVPMRLAAAYPIVLISDTVTQEWIDRLAEGVIDDLMPRSAEPAFLRLRLEAVLRNIAARASWKCCARPPRSTPRWTG